MIKLGLSLVGGFFIGTLFQGSSVSFDNLMFYFLLLLLLLVGVEIGADGEVFKSFRSIRLRIILIPFGALIGSMLGGLGLSFFVPLEASQALLITSGMGYYSLSGVLISSSLGSLMGSISFLTNMFRELITLIWTPFLVRKIGQLAPISAGGSTTMDTTFPTLSEFLSRSYLPTAFVSGLVLTIIVPFILNAFLFILF